MNKRALLLMKTSTYDLEVAIGAGTPKDFENQVKYIPIR
jgi:hypothetical protein